MTRILDPLGSATDYTIDGLGDPGITERTFDAAGNALTETDARGKTTTHHYNALNRLTQSTFEDGSQITHTYDTGTHGLGRLKTITAPQGRRLVEISYPSSRTVSARISVARGA